MLMTTPTVSLVLAAALAVVNLWLSIRVGQVRGAEKVSVGDGGNERVIRRMRAHANFTENAWLIMTLVLVIELSVGSSPWLWVAAGSFVLGRILHGRGMDGWSFGRMSGTLLTMALQLALALWALAIPLTHRAAAPAETMEIAPAQG